MKNCGQQRCPSCDEDMIHRDHRRAWESASAFGQIVWLRGPRLLTTGDIDHYAAVFPQRGGGGLPLLRIIEHKQPAQAMSKMQRKTLLLLGEMFDGAIARDEADPRSGVFVVRGEVGGQGEDIQFLGPQTLEKAHGDDFHEVAVLDDAEAVFRWLEGTAEPGSRRNMTMPTPTQRSHPHA